jgi:hypothetical protein
MGNSIQRPRQRPRVESVNFRTLWWLAAFEAAYRMECAFWTLKLGGPLSRDAYWTALRCSWRQRGQRHLARRPELRFLP